MSGLTLALTGLAAVGFALAYVDPAALGDAGVPTDDRGMMLALGIYSAICAVLSSIAIPLGVLVLGGAKVARALLTVVAVLAFLASVPAAAGILGVVPLALIVGSLIMLHRRDANQWFGSRVAL
ncbi:hypothetical protein WBG06_03580 [Nocardioides sp. CCNWLW239]|uniref:hypothetical protein n=1 Tax=Nocardioides sp. CCNWLW239 TaxID=3128902 RepID=UPI003018A5DF